MSIDVGTAVGYLDLDTSKWSSGFAQAQQQLNAMMDSTQAAGTRFQSAGKLMSQAGGILTKTVTLPLAGLGIAAVKSSMETESSMAKVNSILQLGGKEFNTYKGTIKDGANEIGLAYNKYADAAYDAISSGVKQADVTTFLTGANKLAVGGLTDLTSATNLLTTVQNAYGLGQKDLAHVSDVLIQTQNLGKVTVDELASSMGKIIPTAKGLCVSVDQLGAGYSIMTAKGIAGAEATTYMNSMFNELGKSGTKVDKALKEISGKSFKELMESGKSTGDVLQMLSDYAEKSGLSLTDLFGSSEAGKAALTLLSDGSKEFNDVLKQMEDSAGATDRAFQQLDNTSQRKLAKSMDTLKNALSDMGDVLLPLVANIADAVAKFAQWATAMAQAHPQLAQITAVIAGVLAALGPLLLLLGSIAGAIGNLMPVLGALRTGFLILKTLIMDSLIPALGTLWGFMLANPITLVIAAVAALVAGFVYLWNNCDGFKEFWISMWDSIKEWCSSAIDAVKLKFTEWGTAINEFITVTIPQFIQGIITWFSQLPTIIGTWLTTAWTNITTWCNETLNTFINWCTNVITNIGQWFAQLPYNIGFALGTALGNIAKWISDTWNYFSTNIPKWIESISNWFKELPGKVWQWLVSTYQKTVEWGSQMLQKAVEVGTNFLNKIVQFFTQLPGKVWSFLTQAYQKAVTWGSQMVAKASEAGSQFINKVSSFMQQLPGQVWNFLSQAISKAVSFVTQFAQKGMQAAQQFGSNIKNGLSSIPGQVVSVGTNIVHGLWNGISGAAGWLYGKVKSFATGILDGMKSALGIHSPSRKARDLVGVFIPQGIWQGVAQEMPRLQKNLDKGLSSLFDTSSIESTSVGESFMDSISQGIEGLGLICDNLKDDTRSMVDSIVSDLGRLKDSFSTVEKLRIEALYSNLHNLVQSHEFAIKTLVNEPNPDDKRVKVEIDYDKLAKAVANNSKPNLKIENTYNSPKPASIIELKRQDEIQTRRLGMELGF